MLQRLDEFDQETFDITKSRGLLKLRCNQCHQIFEIQKHYIQKSNKNSGTTKFYFCSNKCNGTYFDTRVKVLCKFCFKKFFAQPKTFRIFCSQSCSAKYNNNHKSFGHRRSKLEIWIEEVLTKLYPTLEIHFNRKDTINSELDIYIPDLKLAFEINGIFHYEPIYGEEKFNSIQNNDNRKFQACLDLGIELCIINVSHQKRFQIKTSFLYLSIITKLLAAKGVTVENHVEVT